MAFMDYRLNSYVFLGEEKKLNGINKSKITANCENY